MNRSLTLCNNCAGMIVLSLGEHQTNPTDEPYPCGLAHDLGCEEGGF